MRQNSFRFDTISSRILAVSFFGHFLFFCGFSFNFRTLQNTKNIDTAYFLGAILSQADLKPGLTKTANNIYLLQPGQIKPKRQVSDVKLSSLKPLNSAQSVSGYPKRLNKFLVIEKKADVKNQAKQRNFEPPRWEKIELRLKAE